MQSRPAFRSQTLVKISTLSFAFALLIAGAQAQTFQVIHSFVGGSDGANPFASLTMDSAGNLYGVASSGGNGSCVFVTQPGCGTIFKLTQNAGSWSFGTLYGFQGEPDGAAPLAPLVIGPNGKLYSTTADGGEGSCSYLGDTGCGIVYELPVTADPAPHDQVLYRFSGGTDGAIPLLSNVIFVGNNMYGTAEVGGDLSCNNPYGCGVVYELSATGQEKVLHAFTGAGGDGAYPLAALVADSSGNLYGTTASGGSSTSCTGGCGTIFEMLHTQSGWTERVLYSFTNTADGSTPDASLIIDSKGNLYGITWQGGAGGGGTVFELHKNANSWSLYVLYSFEISGYALDPLVMDSKGNLYGTTQNGGTYNDGRVFELKPNAKGWAYKELYDFTGGTDGGNPLGGLVIDSSGNLYGTTVYDGSTSCGGSGCGVIFELTP